jgi:hypothetical protein
LRNVGRSDVMTIFVVHNDNESFNAEFVWVNILARTVLIFEDVFLLGKHS